MSDSLIYAGYELLGGGVAQSDGWTARLDAGWDLGTAEPATAVVESLLLDGERVTGDASSDRTIVLPVIVFGATRQIISAGVAALQKAANARSATLQWTPAGGSAAVFDTWRGRTVVVWDIKHFGYLVAQVTLELTALPYARKPTRTSATAGTSVVQLDSCDTAPGSGNPTTAGSATFGTFSLTSNTWSAVAGGQVEGSAQLRLAPGGIPAGGALPRGSSYPLTVVLTRGGLTARDVSAASAIEPAVNWSAILGTGSTSTPGTATLVLRDNAGGTATLTTTSPTLDGMYHRPLFAAPGTWPGGFDPVHVVGYTLTLTATVAAGHGGASSLTVNVDDVEIYPAGNGIVNVANGGLYGFTGIGGTARCPVAIQATRSGGISSLLLHKAPIEARADYTPLVPYGSVGTALAGSAAMPTYLGSTGGARYNGTHLVLLGGASLGGSGNRTVTVTFTETFGDPIFGGSDTSTVSRVCQPSDVLHGFLDIGFLTLPKRAVAADNTATSMTVTVTDSLSGATTVQDVLVLDLRGVTVRVGEANARDTVWVDEPNVDTGVGLVLIGSTIGGSANARASAVANWDSTTIDPGPLSFDPGDNTLLAYCPQGAVTLTATYAERYLAEAV